MEKALRLQRGKIAFAKRMLALRQKRLESAVQQSYSKLGRKKSLSLRKERAWKITAMQGEIEAIGKVIKELEDGYRHLRLQIKRRRSEKQAGNVCSNHS